MGHEGPNVDCGVGLDDLSQFFEISDMYEGLRLELSSLQLNHDIGATCQNCCRISEFCQEHQRFFGRVGRDKTGHWGMSLHRHRHDLITSLALMVSNLTG